MSYCRQKKQSYILLRNFIEKNSKWFMKAETYNITSALALLSPLSSNKVEAAFRNGTLVLTEEMIEAAGVTFNQLKLICEILGSRRADAGKWEEPSEKNWFNAYMDIASLKR